MTLGCGSWGGNVTSDNVSPLHLMDIKRVAFETRPVASKRPAVVAQPGAMPQPTAAAPRPAPVSAQAVPPKVSREEIAAIVDRFLANRQPEPAPQPAPAPPRVEQPHVNGGNGAATRVSATRPASSNGRQAADFVSEEDVKRAIQKGEKIYVGPKTIITPSARDIGDPAEVFAKV
jgi:hypothetical protein